MDSIKRYKGTLILDISDRHIHGEWCYADRVEALRARLVEVEAERDRALQAVNSAIESMRHAAERRENWQARAENAEEQLTLARQELAGAYERFARRCIDFMTANGNSPCDKILSSLATEFKPTKENAGE